METFLIHYLLFIHCHKWTVEIDMYIPNTETPLCNYGKRPLTKYIDVWISKPSTTDTDADLVGPHRNDYGDTATETVLEPTVEDHMDMSVISVNTDMTVSFEYVHVKNFYLPNKLLSVFIKKKTKKLKISYA